jgi:hypothetical protein
MRTLFVVAMVVAGASAPARADIEHAEVPGAPDTAEMKGHVLVWLDARLFLDPNDTAPSIRLATLSKERKDSIGHAVQMKIVGTSGSFVEVEPVAKDVGCTWAHIVQPKSPSITKPKLYVKRADLVPTLFRGFTLKISDGTSLAVQPGVPLGLAAKPDQEGKWVVSLYGEEFRIGPSDSVVGYSFTPRKVVAPPKWKAKKPAWLDAEKVLFGFQEITLKNPWSFPKFAKKDGRALLTMRARCLTAVVSAPLDKVVVEERLMGIPGTGTEGGTAIKVASGPIRYLPKKTPLTSETGTHVVASLAMDAIVTPPPADAKVVCVESHLELKQPVEMAPGGASETKQAIRTLKLCAPVSAIKTR